MTLTTVTSTLLLAAIVGLVVRAYRHRGAALVLFAACLFIAGEGVANAAAGDSIASLQLSPLSVQFVIAVLIPIVTGIITKLSTSSMVKGLVTLVLNAVQSLVVTATLADGTAVISKETFIAFMFSVVVSIAIYTGVYAPAKLTNSRADGLLVDVGAHD